MSRRIKPDRRAAVSEHPETHPELLKTLLRARDEFRWIGKTFHEKYLRDDMSRIAIAMYYEAFGEDIHYLLMELGFVADESTD